MTARDEILENGGLANGPPPSFDSAPNPGTKRNKTKMTQENTEDFALFERTESEVRSYSRGFPAMFDTASGAYLRNAEGKEWIDFLAGCSTLNYGHNHPGLKQALLDYIGRDGLTHGLDMFSRAKHDFLEEFENTILKPRDMDYVVQFPGPTGANAVEAAVKLARKVTGRQNIIAFTNGFHGVTLGALALTGNSHHRQGAGQPLGNVTRMPYDGYLGEDVDTAAQLEKMLDDPSSGVDAPAAIIVESVQGEGGLNAASGEWLKRIEKIARERGALFIVDDIQAGIGRTDGFFSFEFAGLGPDIITLAKSISGYGLPMALVLIHREFDKWKPGEHNGTFRGNCPAFVTARAALEHFWRDDDFIVQVREKAEVLESRLAAIIEKNGLKPHALKGRGMMRGIDVGSGEIADRICKACFEEGLVIETSGPNDEVVKCLMPLTIDKEILERGLDILAAATDKIMSQTRREAA